VLQLLGKEADSLDPRRRQPGLAGPSSPEPVIIRPHLSTFSPARRLAASPFALTWPLLAAWVAVRLFAIVAAPRSRCMRTGGTPAAQAVLTTYFEHILQLPLHLPTPAPIRG